SWPCHKRYADPLRNMTQGASKKATGIKDYDLTVAGRRSQNTTTTACRTFASRRLSLLGWRFFLRSGPDAGHAVLAGGNELLAVGIKTDGQDASLVALERERCETGGQVPEADGPVLAAGGQPLTIRAEGDATDEAQVALEFVGPLACRQVPDRDREV